MARGIFLMNGKNELIEMKEREYDSEDILQDILARFSTLLLDEGESDDGQELLLIKREMEVPSDIDESSRWSADHLFISLEGVPIIVEVKRRTDTRIRREVVGQMLDYAANGIIYWPVENLKKRFENNCRKEGVDPREKMVKFLSGRCNEDTFWMNVKTNLQAGKIKMVFVADVIPKELGRIVEFLNEQMDPAEVIAIEVRQFTDGVHRALVPKIIGQTEEASGRKSATRGLTINEQDFMANVSENPCLFSALLAFDGQNGLTVNWGSSGFSLTKSVGNKNIPICWGYNNASGPGETIQIKFDRMNLAQGSEVFVKKFREMLLNFDFMCQCGSNKEVKIRAKKKLNEQQSNQLIDIIKAIAEEIQTIRFSDGGVKNDGKEQYLGTTEGY